MAVFRGRCSFTQLAAPVVQGGPKGLLLGGIKCAAGFADLADLPGATGGGAEALYGGLGSQRTGGEVKNGPRGPERSRGGNRRSRANVGP
jgi:hypothetical protein